jgi:2-dehydro-3-deoxygalactonokinase
MLATGLADGLVAIDWGTTNRRIFVLDARGALVHRESDARGVTAFQGAEFAGEVAGLRARFGARPFLLAGMIGSNRGWLQTPYLPCPATLPALAANLLWVEPGQTAIVPGARDDKRMDVMRGEEVQLLGAVARGLVAADGLLCLPGTHAKWARLEAGSLAGFRTVMTGEMFALLRNHSLLSPQLSHEAQDGPAFRDGVRRGMNEAALLADLFGARARMLLGALDEGDVASYVSGLLLGAELRIGTAEGEKAVRIGLIGDPRLTRLYAAALDEAGRSYQEIDGEQAFLAGVAGIAEELR